MDVVVKDGIVVGDCVLLNCSDSAGILKARDVDGCQIRLDGEVKSVNGDWCKVLVRLEENRGVFGVHPMSVMLNTKLRDVELIGGSNVWSKLRAKGIDRVRSTGSDECEFWAPLSANA